MLREVVNKMASKRVNSSNNGKWKKKIIQFNVLIPVSWRGKFKGFILVEISKIVDNGVNWWTYFFLATRPSNRLTHQHRVQLGTVKVRGEQGIFIKLDRKTSDEERKNFITENKDKISRSIKIMIEWDKQKRLKSKGLKIYFSRNQSWFSKHNPINY